jgi:hypothetical protein
LLAPSITADRSERDDSAESRRVVTTLESEIRDQSESDRSRNPVSRARIRLTGATADEPELPIRARNIARALSMRCVVLSAGKEWNPVFPLR